MWVCLIREWTYPIHGPFKTKAAAEKWAEGYRYAHKVEVVEVHLERKRARMTPAPREGRASALIDWLCVEAECKPDCQAHPINGWKCSCGTADLRIRARAELQLLLSEADAARAKALEDAAKAVEQCAHDWQELAYDDERTGFDREAEETRRQADALSEVAARIRALAAQDRAKETT